jgi:hypothetical protein
MLINLGHDLHIYSFFVDEPSCYDLAYSRLSKKLIITDISRSNSSFPDLKTQNKISKRITLKILIHKIYHTIKRLLFFIFPLYKNNIEEFLCRVIINNDLRKIKSKLKNIAPYDCCIGIEKGGIICAHEFYKINKVPFFYLSLELYDEKHPILSVILLFKLMREKEIIAHKEASGTIIADEDRKNYLYESAEIDKNKPAFFLPISFDDCIITSDITFQENKISTKKVVFNFGGNRIPDDFLINLLKILPDDYIFLMHNYDTKYHEKLSRDFSLKNIQFSNATLDEHEIMKMISDSFIGISWYQNETANDIFIAFSSEKTARYLAAGIPIIANAKTNFTSLFSLIKCGIAVNSPKEFIDALEIIASDYQNFSERAKEAFDKYYKLSNFEKPLNNFLINNK